MGPIVLVFVALGVIMLLGKDSPIQVDIAYQVAPSLRASPKNIQRVHIREIRTVFLDTDGRQVSVMTMAFPHGLKPPITQAGRVMLPPAEYLARIEIHSRDGRTISRRRLLTVTGSQRMAVELPLK